MVELFFVCTPKTVGATYLTLNICNPPKYLSNFTCLPINLHNMIAHRSGRFLLHCHDDLAACLERKNDRIFDLKAVNLMAICDRISEEIYTYTCIWLSLKDGNQGASLWAVGRAHDHQLLLLVDCFSSRMFPIWTLCTISHRVKLQVTRLANHQGARYIMHSSFVCQVVSRTKSSLCSNIGMMRTTGTSSAAKVWRIDPMPHVSVTASMSTVTCQLQ